MAYTETTNYSLRKPASGDTDWGTVLNWDFDKIDTLIKSNEDDIVSNTSSIATNTSNISSLTTRIVDAESDISSIQASEIEDQAQITTLAGTGWTWDPNTTTGYFDIGGVQTAITIRDNYDDIQSLTTLHSSDVATINTNIGYINSYIGRTGDNLGYQYPDYSGTLYNITEGSQSLRDTISELDAAIYGAKVGGTDIGGTYNFLTGCDLEIAGTNDGDHGLLRFNDAARFYAPWRTNAASNPSMAAGDTYYGCMFFKRAAAPSNPASQAQLMVWLDGNWYYANLTRA